MIEILQEQQRAILVAVDTGEYDAAVSIDELGELSETAGAVVLGKVIQKRPCADKATCVGSGMLEGIKAQAAALRSEEHTSELQSLAPISDSVVCF